MMNIVFLGSSGPLSLIPLNFLLQSEYKPCAIGYETSTEASIAETKYPVIASQNETIEMLASRVDVPAIKLFDKSDAYIDEIKACEPDIVIVSCLASKLPENILSLPRLGCFNLHPSLLPAFRGPTPLFWQFRQGIETFGMTLHRMNSCLDAGPVIAQITLSMPDGVNNQQASELLAEAGTDLLDQYLGKIERDEFDESVQNEAEASYMSYPSDADFVVSTAWTARRIYNFICATQHWGKTYPCEVDGGIYLLTNVESYWMNADKLPLSVAEDSICIPCIDGVVVAKIASDQLPLGA